MSRLEDVPAVGAGAGLLILALTAACGSPRPVIESPRVPAAELDPVPPGATPAAPLVAAAPPEAPPAPAPPPAVEPAVEPSPPPPPPTPPARAGDPLRRRYGLKTAKQVLTGDRGEGYDDLYGTRNVRAVLNGIFYRGGANNVFHRAGKRSNKNPLPADGLENLCRQGFGSAVYLYPTNFDDAAAETTCTTVDGQPATLAYSQRTTQHGKKADLRFIFELIVASVRRPETGAVYVHCWNGWHASGYLGAVALRQFCGFTGDQAVKYWNTTAKGASNPEHDGTRERIRKFKPFADLELTAEERAQICPDPRSYRFADGPEATGATASTP